MMNSIKNEIDYKKITRLKQQFDIFEKKRIQENIAWSFIYECQEIWDLFNCIEQDGWAVSKFDAQDSQIIYRTFHDIENMKNANFDELCKFLTYCVVGEKYCEGHFACCVKIGAVKSIIDRIVIISGYNGTD